MIGTCTAAEADSGQKCAALVVIIMGPEPPNGSSVKSIDLVVGVLNAKRIRRYAQRARQPSSSTRARRQTSPSRRPSRLAHIPFCYLSAICQVVSKGMNGKANRNLSLLYFVGFGITGCTYPQNRARCIAQDFFGGAPD